MWQILPMCWLAAFVGLTLAAPPTAQSAVVLVGRRTAVSAPAARVLVGDASSLLEAAGVPIAMPPDKALQQLARVSVKDTSSCNGKRARTKKNNPANREPAPEAEVEAGRRGVVRRGEAERFRVRWAAGEGVAKVSGRTCDEAAVALREAGGVRHIERSNCGGAVAGGSTREGSAPPSSARRASASLRVEWRLLMVRRPPQGHRSTSVPKVR